MFFNIICNKYLRTKVYSRVLMIIVIKLSYKSHLIKDLSILFLYQVIKTLDYGKNRTTS